MDGLRKQGFWVILGVILLAEAAFFFLGILGKGEAIDELQGKVSRAEKRL